MTRAWLKTRAPAAAATLLGLLLAGSLYGQQTAFEPASYADRLRIPFRNDRLGISRAVTVDAVTQEIMVTDWRYGRVVIFDEDFIFRHVLAGDRFSSSPNEVAVDPEGFLIVLPSVGKSLSYLDFDGAYLGELRLLDLPEDLPGEPRLGSVALSPDGKTVYVLDGRNKRLWLAKRDGQVQRSIDLGAGRDEQGWQDLLFGHVDVYENTVLVSVPTDAKVLLYDLAGNATGHVGLQGTANCRTAFPIAAALDNQGRVLVLDNQRALVSVWQVEGNKCLGEFAGFGGAPGGLYRPLDMTLDARGRVFISQGFEGRVQVYQHDAPAAGTPAARDDVPQAAPPPAPPTPDAATPPPASSP